jgi:hypothetical protein
MRRGGEGRIGYGLLWFVMRPPTVKSIRYQIRKKKRGGGESKGVRQECKECLPSQQQEYIVVTSVEDTGHLKHIMWR